MLPGLWTAQLGSHNFPAIVTTNTSGDTGGTSHTVNLPSGIVTGDLLVVVFHQRNQQTLTWPSGWTVPSAINGASQRLEVAVKVADGTEGSSITVTSPASTGDSAHVSFRIFGSSGTVSVGGGASGSSTTPDPPTVTASWGSDLNLFIAIIGCAVGAGTVSISAWPPTNYTLSQTQQSGVTTATCGMAGKNFQASSDNPGTATITVNTQWICETIVVQPS